MISNFNFFSLCLSLFPKFPQWAYITYVDQEKIFKKLCCVSYFPKFPPSGANSHNSWLTLVLESLSRTERQIILGSEVKFQSKQNSVSDADFCVWWNLYFRDAGSQHPRGWTQSSKLHDLSTRVSENFKGTMLSEATHYCVQCNWFSSAQSSKIAGLVVHHEQLDGILFI